jgi:hypothetical protein
VVRAIERKQLYVFAPASAGVYWRLKRLMPRVLLNLIARRNARESAAAKA